MRRIIGFALTLGVLGLVIGYLIFGKIAGEYVSISALFGLGDDLLSRLSEAVMQLSDIRQNILISGAVGLGVGVVAGAVFPRR
jgi:hypothetical protein